MDREQYKIADLALMTQLSQRTIRNYMRDGRLNGQKIQGTWIFTREDLQSFFEDPYIKQALLIKNQVIIDDFMKGRKKKNACLCTIYDYPVFDKREAEEFCQIVLGQMKLECYQGIKMSYYYDESCQQIRIIFIGEKEKISSLLSCMPGR